MRLSYFFQYFYLYVRVFINVSPPPSFSQNENIMNTVFYEVNWYDESKENKKLILMFHLLIKTTSKEIAAFSNFPASRYTFGGIVRISYTLLRLVRDSLSIKQNKASKHFFTFFKPLSHFYHVQIMKYIIVVQFIPI